MGKYSLVCYFTTKSTNFFTPPGKKPYLPCIFVLVIFFFFVDIQNFAGNENLFRKSGQKEFPTPLAGIADQVLQQLRSIFFCFLLLSEVKIKFENLFKKIDHCHFVDNKIYIMTYVEVLTLYFGRA